jgi:hypothetical protein
MDKMFFDARADVWQTGQDAARLIEGYARRGATPITRLYVGGHHWPNRIGVMYSPTVANTEFTFGDIAALAANLGVGDNSTNTYQKAVNREGPPRCWFSRDAKVYGLACFTGTQGGNSWAKQWFDGVGRERGSFFGTKDMLWGYVQSMTAAFSAVVGGIRQYSLHITGAKLWVGERDEARAITSLSQVSQWEGNELIRVGL